MRLEERPGPAGPSGLAGTDETEQPDTCDAVQEIVEFPPPLMQVGIALIEDVAKTTVTATAEYACVPSKPRQSIW